MVNLIDITDLTTYAPDVDVSAFSNTTLSGIVSQATKAINDYCQVKGFERAAETGETFRAALSPMGELMVDFKRRPVSVGDVSQIKLVKGGFSTTLSLTDSNNNPLYQIPDPGQRLYFPSSYLAAAGTLILGGSTQLVTMRGADVFVSVDYSGGYYTIPDDLKLACMLWCRDIINWRYNALGANSFTQGSLSVQYSADADSRLLKQAKRILNQGGYVRTSLF